MLYPEHDSSSVISTIPKSPIIHGVSIQTMSQTNSSKIGIYYQNVRGLRSKHREFFCSSSSCEWEIIALSETWLNASHKSAEYFDSTFSIFRKDRYETGSSLSLGGGVLLAIHSKLASTDVQLPNTENLECICAKIDTTRKSSVYIYVAYIPPKSINLIYEKHLAAIGSIPSKPNDNVFILGDFNIQSKWILDETDSNVLVPFDIKPNYVADFLQNLSMVGLHQVNHVRNHQQNLLDLVFTNDVIDLDVTQPLPLSKIDDYHPPLLISIEWLTSTCDGNNQKPQLCFKRTDFYGLNNYLDLIDFHALFADKTLDGQIEALYDVLLLGINMFVPKTVIHSNSKCPWSNRKLRQLKNRRNKESKRFKLTGDRIPYDEAYTEFETLNSELYNGYIDNMKSRLKSDPTSFWRYVNSKRDNDGKPKFLFYADKSSHNENEQAELFAEFFKSNYGPLSTEHPVHDSISSAFNPFELFTLTEQCIFEGMMQINTKKGVGPDGIHPLILRNCSAILCRPLAVIFNTSLTQGIFPARWKRSSVSPIHKKGSRSNIENYRCIAKLPTIAKFFEHLVNMELTKMVEKDIVHNQHGFMKRKSTNTNLMEFVNFCHKAMLNGSQVDVLYTDFSKAFDRVNHSILREKLNMFDVPLNLQNWISSYVSQRHQFVRFGTSESNDFEVSSGVPQGSHIGPTLFLLFINDIVKELGDEVFVSLFADDLKIAGIINKPTDSTKIQNAINRLEKWCETNCLHLNLDKCAVLSLMTRRTCIPVSYNYGDHLFKQVTEFKDLGVLMDSKINFAKHIDTITSKAATALGFIKRFCYDFRDIPTLKALYYSLVQSQLEYCSTVWYPVHNIHINKIESVQKQFTMFALNEYPNESNNYRIDSYSDRLKKLDMHSLHRRRINSAMYFMYDLLNASNFCSNLKNEIVLNPTNRNLRRTEFIKLSDRRMELSLLLPLNRFCRLCNKVPEMFTIDNKKQLKTCLLRFNAENLESTNFINSNTIFSHF